MLSVAVYTFRSFPKIDLLKSYFPDIYIFGRLKENIESFCGQIGKEKPAFIVGIARSGSKSVVEPVAVNNMHGSKIIKDAPKTLSL